MAALQEPILGAGLEAALVAGAQLQVRRHDRWTPHPRAVVHHLEEQRPFELGTGSRGAELVEEQPLRLAERADDRSVLLVADPALLGPVDIEPEMALYLVDAQSIVLLGGDPGVTTAGDDAHARRLEDRSDDTPRQVRLPRSLRARDDEVDAAVPSLAGVGDVIPALFDSLSVEVVDDQVVKVGVTVRRRDASETTEYFTLPELVVLLNLCPRRAFV